MEKVYLLLGSNLGNRLENINTAIDKISDKVGQVINQSPLYKTSPWGLEAQPEFLNKEIGRASCRERV